MVVKDLHQEPITSVINTLTTTTRYSRKASTQSTKMIRLPENIRDAQHLEPIALDMLDSWNDLRPEHRVQEMLCGSDFYQTIVRCKGVLKMLEDWRYDRDILNIDNSYDD